LAESILGSVSAPCPDNPPQLALVLALVASVAIGLPLWPLVAAMALWQFRYLRLTGHTPQRFAHTLPFRWQTFAYPLPGLRAYLFQLARQHGSETAFAAIQAVQFRSLQMYAARRAVLDLATNSITALEFCGQVAIATNAKTLAPLSLAGPAARAVAVLVRRQDGEEKQPLQLYAGKSLPEPYLLPFFPIEKELQAVRTQRLPDRLTYALRELEHCQEFTGMSAFRTLLKALQDYANPAGWIGAPREATPGAEEAEQQAWIRGGWQVLERLRGIAIRLDAYQELTTPRARREFLEHQVEALQGLTWEDLPGYWGAIGKELVAHWVQVLKETAREASEWLQLEVSLPQPRLNIGPQSLQLRLYNPTAVIAQEVRVQVEPTPGLEWYHREARQPLLEGGREALLRLGLEASREGQYRIAGSLSAQDLAGNPFVLPFAFRIDIARAGRPYRLPEYSPYVVGEGLPDDRTFVGRQELLAWLRGLWLQPQGKPAVVLVGQRRIGKTSLLNKIARDGLPGTRLLPLKVDIQEVSGDYDFLHTVAGQMAQAAQSARPALDRAAPYADFKEFFRGLRPALGERRFLLMLDEADQIPKRHLGDQLPGFLRALMQGPEYPIVVLFCGTYALGRMGREYDSILFNTAQVRPVSYLTEAESAEVLTKPAQGLLEYDPAVLAEAYRVTRGQPLVLQSLGATLIRLFNAEVFAGRKRSNYVDTKSVLGKRAFIQ
jgi:hypothetical protein